MGVYDVNIKISQKYIKFKLKLDLFFQNIHNQFAHTCHNMAIEFIKVDATDHLGSPWNISQNKTAPYAAWMGK